MKKLFFMGIFLLPNLLHAQIPKTLDSMEIYLKTKPKDTTYTKVMKDCAFQYIYKGNYAKADSLGRQVEILAKKIDFPKAIYYHYLIFASIANYKSDTRHSLEYFLKGLEIVEKNNLSKFWLEASLNNVAISYEALGEHDTALKYALRAIDVEEKYPVDHLDGSPYEVVGSIYKNAGKYEKALKYYENALKIATNNHLSSPKTTQYVNGMASVENSIGNLFDSWKKPKEAKLHYQKGLEIVEKVDSKLEQTDLLTNLGNVSKDLVQYDQAENYYKRSEKICKELDSDIGLQTVYVNLGDLYLLQKKYELAEKYYQESLNLARKLKHLEKVRDANESLANFYAETKNFQKAYQFSAVVSSLKDSVSKIETFKNSQELLAKYETEKKETQIELLNEESKAANFQRNALLGGGVLAILLAGISIFSLQNRNKLKRFQENQKLRNRISADLHDEIGSTLSSISILSEMVAFQQKKGEFKPEIMAQVSNDAQEVIEKMDDIIWTINPENDAFYNLETRLKTFAIPLFESKDIEFKISFSAELEAIKIDMAKRRDIYLILKEAINNLVKYSEAKNAKIEGKIEAKILIMSVLDDGKGFDTNAENARNGQKNMQNRAMKIGADLTVKSEISKGTQVSLSVKL